MADHKRHGFKAIPRYRICHIIDHLSLHGAQVYLAKLVRGLADIGYEQRVFGLNDPRSPEIVEMLDSAGAGVETIGKARLLSLWGPIRLFTVLRNWRPHILQTFLPFSDVIGRTLAHYAGVPVIVSVVTQPNVDKYRLHYAFDRITAPWAHRIVFNSKTIIPFALSKEGVKSEQVKLIPNGIELDPPSRPKSGFAIRSQLGIQRDSRVIGCVARLYPQKGHAYLLDAFSMVNDQVPNTVLVLIGGGPLMDELKAQASKLGIDRHVRFLGDRSDLPDILDCMDLYVQASLWEGMSIALMQAMLSGLPVVATQVDGTTEILQDGATGFLVKPADSRALARRIVYALENKEETRQMAERGSAMVRRDFSVERMVDSFDQLYRELIDRSTGSKNQ